MLAYIGTDSLHSRLALPALASRRDRHPYLRAAGNPEHRSNPDNVINESADALGNARAE